MNFKHYNNENLTQGGIKMKYKRIILAILLAMTMGSNGFIYANGARVEYAQSQEVEESLAELYHKAGLDSPEVHLC